jgi:hypothetical protein
MYIIKLKNGQWILSWDYSNMREEPVIYYNDIFDRTYKLDANLVLEIESITL